jgi:hypothetical protein
MSTNRLPASGPHSIPPFKSARFDESREKRLARHLAWCDLLHHDRLAAAAERRAPRALPQRLWLVTPTRAAQPGRGT